MLDLMRKKISECLKIKNDVLADERILNELGRAAATIIVSYKNGGKVFFCGNGGSAADAQHLAAELVFKFYIKRKPLPAEALSVNTSVISAVSNDESYDNIFSVQLEANAKPGDVLVGLSTGGNSKSVINAMKKAREMNIITVGFTGSNKCSMDEASDILLKVPSGDTPRIQEVHIMLGHILCEIVESSLFG
ncbi:MAG: SIS domain-containing protein [Spirochaetes bacterium]|nr:SIS domain-containing protein [Spirochaetota bacterium]